MSWWDLSDRCRQNKTGPQRSALSRSHGPFGRGLIFSGSRCMTGFLIAWHATHLPIILSNSSLMFGNQILERINYFVFLDSLMSFVCDSNGSVPEISQYHYSISSQQSFVSMNCEFIS